MAINKEEVFDYGVVWIEFGPTLILLAREWIVARRSHQNGLAESVA
jgi:hypothetical protein